MATTTQTTSLALALTATLALGSYAGYKYGYKGDKLPTVNLKMPDLSGLKAKLPSLKKASE